MFLNPLALVLSAVSLSLLGSAVAQQDNQDCRLDAAMTVGFDFNQEKHIQFLFRGPNAYQVKINRTAKTIELSKSSSITDYWTKWTGTQVTRTWSWNEQFHSHHWQGVIGDNQSTHLTTFSKEMSKGMSFTFDFDSLKTIVESTGRPLPAATRSSYISVYAEPGYVWVQNYPQKEDDPPTYKSVFYIDITDDNLNTKGSEKFEYKITTNLTTKNINTKKFQENFNWNEMQLTGVLFTGWVSTRDDVFDIYVVVFVEHQKKTKHCFGVFTTESENCTQPSHYQNTDIELFGCVKPTKPPPTTLETTSLPPTESLPIELIIAVISGVVFVVILLITCWRCYFTGKQKKLDKTIGSAMSSNIVGSKAGSGVWQQKSGTETDDSGSGSGSEEEKSATAPLLKKQSSLAKSGSSVGSKTGGKSVSFAKLPKVSGPTKKQVKSPKMAKSSL